MSKKLGANALYVFKKLYYDEGETRPKDVFTRISKAIIKLRPDLSQWEERFIKAQHEHKIRVNTPAMMNLGCSRKQVASACFVGDLQDSMPSIKRFYDDATEVFLAGSGIGANFSELRERDAGLSTGGSSSGPISFIRHLNSLGGTIKSGGKTRRAAAMVVFDITHPDVLDIVKLKTTEALENINISINCTDEFMKAVQDDEMWELKGVKDKQVKTRLKARQILLAIAECSYACGDPGVVFLDRVNRFSTVPGVPIRSSNPCGEQFLIPYGSCNLASINIAAHFSQTAEGAIDWDELEETVRIATRLLDGMLDACEYPTKKFKEVSQATRNIGIGIMGLSDTLIHLGLPYDSPEARETAGRIMECVTRVAWDESANIADEHGPFPLYDEAKERIQEVWGIIRPVRNSQVTTIAPTGTVSISCDCSSGMEPLFAIVYDKKISDTGDIMTFVHPEFQKRYQNERWYSVDLINSMKNRGGSIQKFNEIPNDVKRLWKTAHDIGWIDRVLMQAELQKYVTNSISSTVNLPNATTTDVIQEIVKTAYEQGLKGITIYRDGSITTQPVKFGGVGIAPELRRVKRPKRLRGFTDMIRTGEGNMYVTINEMEGAPVECFVEIGKSGANKKAHAEALGRMVSLNLQMGGSVHTIYEQLIGIAGKDIVWDEGKQVLSIYDGLAKVLWEEYLNPDRDSLLAKYDECPVCHGRYIHKEGCAECLDCGFSKCG
jgi:ribonucleoside-diphosphate reductase alpha chain